MKSSQSIQNSTPCFRRTAWSVCIWVLVIFGPAARANSVLNSKHNLSVTGPGNVKASTETDACIFCHTVHRTTGQTPLWSHTMSSVSNYVVYSSATLKAIVGQPDGSSRLCLSCHDGTVALGLVSSRTTPIQMQGGVITMPAGPGNLGTDLSGDHPISFVYDQNLATQNGHLKDPAMIDRKLKLDHAQKLQCVTCHDPHDDQFGKFLVMDNTGSILCLSCHMDPSWGGSAHGLSSAPLIGAAATLTTAKSAVRTVAANACENCHMTHKAGSKARLLIHAKEEDTCFTCHNGTVVGKNLTAEFNKPSTHPILQTSSVHNQMENPVSTARHTSCADCHNPHAATAKAALPPNLSGSIAGVKGVNSAGAVINTVTREYELCFRCHADSLNRGPARVTRQVVETNTRLEFSPANASFHPVETLGKNHAVPSLISPWTTSSLMLCTDCHNNDQGPGAGGVGPNGPHGSAYVPLLERALVLTDFTAENPAAYALCYKCHSRTSILNDEGFKYHRLHVADQKTACTTCHDSHGVAGKSRLINFNTIYATPSSNGRLEFISTGTLRGNCSVSCHGKDHGALPYSP